MIQWNDIERKAIVRLDNRTYVIRVASKVSNLEPTRVKVYRSRLLEIEGYYNKRGYCIGYTLTYSGVPKIMEGPFYIVIDYAKAEHTVRQINEVSLNTKNDQSICLTSYGSVDSNKMYVFVYRRKKE